MEKLSEQEIKQRLIRLRNLEYLYEKQKIRIISLETENRNLKEQVATLTATVQQQNKTIEDLKLQMEELKTIVFRKKKPKDKDHCDNHFDLPSEKVQRTTDSYKRPTPDKGQITKIESHKTDTCFRCGTRTTQKKIFVFYEEDIPIPVKKIIVKHKVEKGWCPHCKKWQQAIPLPNSEVILGPNVQKYVCYLSTMCRLSFSQIQNLLQDTYQIQVSQGEISKILERESVHLGPFYEQLKEKIRNEPAVHLDETGWKLFSDPDKSFSWVMSGSQSNESVFLIGENRGKGNVEKLIDNYDGIVVTDDYGAYRKLENHQLCWAHLIRKFRDLANSQELNETHIDYCKKEYKKLCLIYSDMKDNCKIENYDKFFKKLFNFSKIREGEPRKMARLKTTLRKNISNYLTCLKNPNIPMTNNLAERSLRYLVIKRRISFGSFCKRTADRLAVLLSCLMSLKQRHRSNFFAEYLKV